MTGPTPRTAPDRIFSRLLQGSSGLGSNCLACRLLEWRRQEFIVGDKGIAGREFERILATLNT